MNSTWIKSVKNRRGQTFRVGARVRHNEGWAGTITAIREETQMDPAILFVQPDPNSRFGVCDEFDATFAGLSMGNYTPIN